MKCDYGCGKEGKYKLKNGKICCSKHHSQCLVLRTKNTGGGKVSSTWKKGQRHKTTTCKFCGKEITNSNLKKHEDYCEKSKILQICIICGENFLSPYKRRKTCSDECCNKLRSQSLSSGASERMINAYKDGNFKPYGGNGCRCVYNGIKLQSSYEYRTCIILDRFKTQNQIFDWEYTSDKIQYIAEDKKQHTYFLDFKIFTSEKDFYYLEVKGFKKERDDYKWNAVKKLGFNFEVWFLKDIEKWEKATNTVKSVSQHIVVS